MVSGYSDTSASSIWNVLVVNTSVSEIKNVHIKNSLTEKKVTLIIFYHHLSKKSILVRDSMTAIDLTIGSISDHLNESVLPQVGANSLLSTIKAHGFGIAVHDFSRHNSVNQYIQYVLQGYINGFLKGLDWHISDLCAYLRT